MGKTLTHAEREFEILESNWDGTEDQKPVILEFKDEILALVSKFGDSGQSGGSAPFVSSAISQAIKHLCMQETIAPLTGEDIEWEDISKYGVKSTWYQNKRNSAVFKDDLGEASYNNAIIFQGEEEYETFTGTVDGISSSQHIKSFPFYPKRFYINVTKTLNNTDPSRVTCGDGDYVYHIKDKSQLKQVWEIYKEN